MKFARKVLGVVAALFVVCLTAVYSQAQTPTPRLQTREAIEDHLKSFSTSNDDREVRIRKWFVDSGCKRSNLSEQIFAEGSPGNVICVLPGASREAIVIGAHTDKVQLGDGVVDNWTGAVLLPALFYSLSAHPRHHTLIFIGFSGEERGLLGSRYYVDHLTATQRARIDAMVNFDSLGLGPTEVWASHADPALLDALRAVADADKLTVKAVEPPEGASADSESFALYHVPRITLHTVTEKNWSILHSPLDTLAEIKMNDYYDSYRLIATYLAYLDDSLKSTAAPRQ